MGKRPRLTVEVVSERLAEFLAANPDSKIDEIDGPEGKRPAILQPWGDRSLVLLVPDDSDTFIAALNNLILPNRYSAIWHRDTKDFEILWTAFRPLEPINDIPGRQFSFNFQGKQYACEFAHSSERVSIIVNSYQRIAASETGYRNLESFRVPSFLKHMQGDPLSFWIRDVEWNEDDILTLALHLNFYISYFDKLSPVILIHSPPHKTVWALPPRYLAGAFPKHINSQDVDTNALFLWEAAQQGDNQRRFLYYYRIIEYSSSFYLDSTTRAALRIALAQPNALDDLSAVTDSVVSAVQKMKMDEPARFEAMLREIINPASLWREMNQNLTAFTTETEFEGGYKVAPLFAIGRTEANFTTQDVGIFAYALRNLRNALSHGRDPRTATTITPTTHNFARLQPWVSISRFAASQVILYKGIF